MKPFANRAAAGRELAPHLQQYRGRTDVLVLGLPRGGVPVAAAGSPKRMFEQNRIGATSCAVNTWFDRSFLRAHVAAATP